MNPVLGMDATFLSLMGSVWYAPEMELALPRRSTQRQADRTFNSGANMALRDDDIALVNALIGRLNQVVSGLAAATRGAKGGWNIVNANYSQQWSPIIPTEDEYRAAERLHNGE